MTNIAVLGCGFGDEGKGRVVHELCCDHPNSLVVRFSGGHQAGHHVVTDKVDHVFSNFGCGTPVGVPTYWSKFCTVDPVGLIKELKILLSKGVHPQLFIDQECPITTPYDKHANIRLNEVTQHGTCGVGFGTTLQREEDFYSLKFKDLFHPIVRDLKLEAIQNYYGFDLNCNQFLEDCNSIVNSIHIDKMGHIPDYNYNPIIFEGSQGLLLDQHMGFFPYVSRTNTNLKNIVDMGFKINTVYFVTRAFLTRHGNGPLPCELFPLHVKKNLYEKNVYNEFQGEFRFSTLNLDLLDYVTSTVLGSATNYIMTHLVVTCMDLLELYPYIHKYKQYIQKDEKGFITALRSELSYIDNFHTSHSPLEPIRRFY